MKNLLRLTSFVLFTIYFNHLHLNAQNFNYGEALQKSLLFYEAQQSGKLPSWNRVSWRADSGLDHGQDVGIDLTGGWYDAGDHVKFNFPLASTVTMLAWGGIEYEEAYRKSGQLAILKRNLRFTLDYMMKCHTGPTELYVQVGNGEDDHSHWVSAEVMSEKIPQRISYKITASKPGTDIAAEFAAAFAASSILFKDSNPTYSARLLRHAEELYDFADNFRGIYSESVPEAASFYRSFSGFQDELPWGAAWLYRATNKASYLAKARAEYDKLDNELGSDVKAYGFAHSWDDKRYGTYVLMALLTGEQEYIQDAQRHFDFWTVGYEGRKVTYSPGGQAHLIQWGSLRYMANTVFLAGVLTDKVNIPARNKQRYSDFAFRQINYALGDNPINRSFLCGFGNNPANNPHHRGTHGTWTNNLLGEPQEASHTLIGALVGGPRNPDDQFEDDRGDFIANEVATDYNAGFTGAVARLYNIYGGNPLTNFPIDEVPTRDELRVRAKFNSNNATSYTPSLRFENRTAWPARITDKITMRYYFNISEGIEAGYSIDDYTIRSGYSQGPSTIETVEVNAASGIYYVEISLEGDNIAPVGQSEHRREVQLNISANAGVPFDASNDWSAQGIGGGSDYEVAQFIPVYDNGVLVFGRGPDDDDVNRRPIAKIDNNVSTGIAPLEINFDGSNSSDPDGDSLTYLWNFGNGQTSTRRAASVTYTEPGTYEVSLVVNDGKLNSRAEIIEIIVTDGSPIASFTASTASGLAPLDVTFDASGSTDPSGGTLSYNWDLGNGETANTVVTSATYTELGEVTITLTVTNTSGQSDSVSKVITVREDIDNDCTYGTPSSNALASIENQYSNIYVLGENGPDLSNISTLSINWDAANNGLYVFALNTTNGQPDWYVSLLPNLTQNFNSPNPEISLSGTGISGLDGKYWVTIDQGNFVMVSQDDAFTLYFSNSSTAPDCATIDPVDVNGGTITGGPFIFTVGDGVPDFVDGITLLSNVGTGSQWVITDDANNILGLPASPEDVNFDESPAGTCLIWHLSFNGSIEGAEVGNNVSQLSGNFDLSNSLPVERNPVIIDGNCKFNTPRSNALPGIEKSFTKAYVLGNGGPDLGNIREFTINWDLANKGLYVFALNTTNGQPNWYVDLRPGIVQSFGAARPDISISGSNIPRLNGNYWVTLDQGNFVMVSKGRDFTIYFSNSSAPQCNGSANKNPDSGKISKLYLMPNPASDYVDLSSNFDLKDSSVKILSMTGSVVKRMVIKNSGFNHTFPISGLASGLYVVEITNHKNGIQMIEKLIVEER